MGSRDDELELAQSCAAGDEAAWDRFVREYRPVLYRAADALDPSGSAREVADGLYAELYGLKESGGVRQSLFRYYQGRSSLATWLRAVLAQRYVDRVRSLRRLDPIPDDEGGPDVVAAPVPVLEANPDRPRQQRLVREALAHAIARLPDRDRLRLSCYYSQSLTLAETGRILHEHEATVSRHLTRTKRALREAVTERLRVEHGLTPDEIAECFAGAVEDPGPLDLDRLLSAAGRKNPTPDRSI